MKEIKKFKEDAFEKGTRTYYVAGCPGCESEIVVSPLERGVTIEKHEPREIESVPLRFVEGRLKPGKPRKETVSSDPSRDVFSFTCPVCGGEVRTERRDMKHVGPDGENSMTFKLNEAENARAAEFIRRHTASCDKSDDPLRPGCSFSYIFTPTGIGDGVKIRCNKCGEEQDVTDIDSW